MDLLEAKKTLRDHGYTLLKENHDFTSFAYFLEDEIERYLDGCEFLEGRIEKDKTVADPDHVMIKVVFNKVRFPTGPNSAELRPSIRYFNYYDDHGTWKFDDGSRYRTGSKLNMRNYTIETLEDLDNQLGWELQKQ